MEKIKVSGKIIFPKIFTVQRCIVYIRVQDTSMADAPAKTIAETEIDFLRQKLSPSGELPFSLHVQSPILNTRDYTLFVHVDADGDKSLSKGDFIHDQSYPITQGELLIRLREVS